MGKHKKGNKRAPVRQPHRSLLLSSLFALSERVSGMYNATMEKLAVTFYVFLWLVLPVMVTWLPFYILFCTPIWWFVPLYATWYVYDYKTPWKGGRPFRWWQNCVIWKHFRDYFPIELVKTADLPADRNYIFGSHPHGLLSVGIFCNMVTNGNGFREKFPGLEPTVVTLDGQFRFPIRREVAIAIGGTGAARESLHWLLQHPGKGRAIAIVVGGAEEALDARPGCTRLCLLRRKGFVRMALQHRCGLVPVFHFGENDLYTQWGSEEGTRLRYVQTKIKEIVGFCPPIVSGSGLLISIGLLPRRRRVTTVIGSPISYEAPDLAFGERPSEADVDRVHGIYMAALSNLFEEHKHKYGFKNDAHLEFY